MTSFRKYGGVSFSSKHNFVGAQQIFAKSETMALTKTTYLNVYSTATIGGSLTVEGMIYANGGLTLPGGMHFTTLYADSINVPFTDSSKWYIESDGSVTGTQFSLTSDYRIKKDIVDLYSLAPYTRSSFDRIRPVRYTNTLTGTTDYGVIAHEINEIFPELVTGTKDMTGKHQTVNYMGIIALLIHEVQELKRTR